MGVHLVEKTEDSGRSAHHRPQAGGESRSTIDGVAAGRLGSKMDDIMQNGGGSTLIGGAVTPAEKGAHPGKLVINGPVEPGEGLLNPDIHTAALQVVTKAVPAFC